MPAKYTRVDCTCEHCGASFTRPASAMKKPGGGRFCSNQCKGAAFRGDQSPRWRGGNVTRECARCGASFVTRATLVRSGTGRFCSLSCSSSQPKPRKKPSPGIKMAVFECRYCGVLFEREPAQETQGRGLHCSRACYEAQARKNRTRPCALCGTPFESYNRKRIHCSMSCAQSARTGAKAARWKGGITLRTRTLRHTLMCRRPYRDWRNAVLARDCRTCQRCGKHGGKLHAHHRSPWKTHPDLRYEIANGLTLCLFCHRAEHTRNPS